MLKKMKKSVALAATVLMLATGAGMSEAAPNDIMEPVISQLQAEDIVDMMTIGTCSVEQIVSQYKNPANRDMLVNAAIAKGEDVLAAKIKSAYDILSPATSFTNKDMATSMAVSMPGAEEFKIGCAYGAGNGKNQNDAEAFHYYKMAADMGHSRAMCYTGILYEHGKGTKQDPAQARIYFQRAAEAGDPYGQYLYGWALVEGYGGAKDVKSGIVWLEKSAAAKTVGALKFLGDIYASNDYSIIDDGQQRVIKLNDKEKALEYYRMARDTGKPMGQYTWGKLYYDGYLVNRDYKEAISWFLKAGNQDYKDAMDKLDYMYRYGYDVDVDREKADYWRMRKNNAKGTMIASGTTVNGI